MKNKKSIGIIIFVIVILIVIIMLLMLLGKEESLPNNPISVGDELKLDSQIEILEDGKVEVSNFKVNYNEQEKRWQLVMTVENFSNTEVDLNNYQIELYNKDEKLITNISGDALGGLLSPKMNTICVVGFDIDISKTSYLKIHE